MQALLTTLTLSQIVEWTGAIFGAAGALLLACNNRASGYGFVLFLVSNAALAAFGWMTNANGIVAMQVVCTVTTVIGLWRWLLKPRFSRSPSYGDELTMLPVHQLLRAGPVTPRLVGQRGG